MFVSVYLTWQCKISMTYLRALLYSSPVDPIPSRSSWGALNCGKVSCSKGHHVFIIKSYFILINNYQIIKLMSLTVQHCELSSYDYWHLELHILPSFSSPGMPDTPIPVGRGWIWWVWSSPTICQDEQNPGPPQTVPPSEQNCPYFRCLDCSQLEPHTFQTSEVKRKNTYFKAYTIIVNTLYNCINPLQSTTQVCQYSAPLVCPLPLLTLIQRRY